MPQDRSVMIVAGEASADLHGAKLVETLRLARSELHVWGVGGKAMREVGFDAVVPAEKISVAGLTEVLFAIPRIWGILRKLTALVKERRPDVVVLIDLPDFNLRLAQRIHALGIPIVYYISPQVWAWRQKRVELIRKVVTQMLVILPFEQAFYQKHGVRAQFVGHPLVEELPEAPDRDAARRNLNISDRGQPVIAILPGSRDKEVSRHLPVMLEGIRLLKRHFPELVAFVPVASTIPMAHVQRLIAKSGVRVNAVPEGATEVLSAADAAVVCSGTATLQTALLSRPMVVVYRVSWLTYQILKRLVKVAHIALVNLIANRRLVTELVQGDLTAENISTELRKLLEDPVARMRLNQEFAGIRRALGRGGTATQVSRVVLNYIPDGAAQGHG
jgi:lipid-A-disaccharide synthase